MNFFSLVSQTRFDSMLIRCGLFNWIFGILVGFPPIFAFISDSLLCMFPLWKIADRHSLNTYFSSHFFHTDNSNFVCKKKRSPALSFPVHYFLAISFDCRFFFFFVSFSSVESVCRLWKNTAKTRKTMQAHCINLMAHWWCGKWKMSRDCGTEIAIADCRLRALSDRSPISFSQFSSADSGGPLANVQCHLQFISFGLYFRFVILFGSPFIPYNVLALIASRIAVMRESERASATSHANAFQNDRRNNHNDKISMKNMLMKWHRFNI